MQRLVKPVKTGAASQSTIPLSALKQNRYGVYRRTPHQVSVGPSEEARRPACGYVVWVTNPGLSVTLFARARVSESLLCKLGFRRSMSFWLLLPSSRRH